MNNVESNQTPKFSQARDGFQLLNLFNLGIFFGGGGGAGPGGVGEGSARGPLL